MMVVQVISAWDHAIVEAVFAGLVSTDQQDCAPPRIKGRQRAERTPVVLGSQFLHIRVPRAFEGVRVRPREAA